MNRRGTETVLAYATLALLVPYVPLETWTALPGGLLDPFYLVDVVAMILLLYGALHSLRSRPRPAPEILCIAFAWSSANGWRATSWRLREIQEGGALDHGSAELWAVAVGTVLSLAAFVALFVLVVLEQRRRAEMG